MSDMIDTTEMYLRTVFELEEEGIVPMRARIAERLGHSGPTVSQTIARMERDGLVRVTDDRHLELSATGCLAATRVMRKHRLAERLLVDILGLEWEYVHEEACRWEHVMSERVERRILALIGDHRDSPWGNPSRDWRSSRANARLRTPTARAACATGPGMLRRRGLTASSRPWSCAGSARSRRSIPTRWAS